MARWMRGRTSEEQRAPRWPSTGRDRHFDDQVGARRRTHYSVPAHHRLNILIAPEDHDLLLRLATLTDRTMSAVVRTLIRDEASSRGLVVGAHAQPEAVAR